MDENQNKFTLSQNDVDIIGEVSNISMGSAATALSNIMGKKVTITSPHVEMGSQEALERLQQVPSLGVIISYTEGVVGQNFLVIRQDDATEIVKAMMGDVAEGEEFGEIQISAIAEVMNQMMGSSATALSNFLGRAVNISPPTAFMLTEENKREKLDFIFSEVDKIVLVRFLFQVENVLESELYMIMTPEFSHELVEGVMENLDMSGAAAPEAPAAPEESAAPQTEPVPQAAAVPSADSVPSAEPVPSTGSVPPAYEPPAAAAPPKQSVPSFAAPAPQREASPVAKQPAPANVRPVRLSSFDEPAPVMSSAEQSNFELIRDVPLELSVEVGKAHKLVKEIIDFTVGSIIELDKQAGDPVDIVVNGQLIAHGEVVVIDESFGVRITEIIDPKTQGNSGR